MQKDIEVLNKIIEAYKEREEILKCIGYDLQEYIQPPEKAIKCMDLLPELVNLAGQYNPNCRCDNCLIYAEKLNIAKELLNDGEKL